MKYDFDKYIERTGTNCEKWDAREAIFKNRDVIPLWVADMDFEIAEPITQAIKARADHAVYGYSFRDEAYHKTITDWLTTYNGWQTEPQWLEFTPGVVVGFVVAIRALTNEGDGIVINTPVYPPFARMIKANGRRIIESPMVDNGDGYIFDFEDLEKKLARSKALLFCNPHNPTGRVYTREELEHVAALCVKHNIVVISDEIHSDLLFKPHKHIHIASLNEKIAALTTTLVAPSKSFNIAGLSTSVAVIPNESMRRAFNAEMGKLHIEQGNVFGAVALKAAYGECRDWLEQVVDYMQDNRDYVADFIAEKLPMIRTHKPEGTYLMWFDMRGLGMEHEQLFDFLVNKAGLGLNDGAMFGQQGRGFMRLNLATRRDVLRQAMEQLHTAINQLK